MKIRLKGIKNVRDFSEYGHEGYIRSAHLNGATEQDIKTLTETYHLRTIVDLRTTQEAEEKPDAVMEGVTYLHIPIFDIALPGISHERGTDGHGMDEQNTEEIAKMIPNLQEMYYSLVTEEETLGQIRKVMDIINDREREGAILWHCTEGKDRCGIISALFLLSRGVSEKEVMKDYLRTNRVNFTKAWRYYFLIMIARKGKAFARQLRDVFLAKREYLEPIMGILKEEASTMRERFPTKHAEPKEDTAWK